MNINDIFRKFAARVASASGNPWAFIVALAIIAIWAFTGPTFGFSNTWQLFINTGTTIVTLLMVFLIQNTQNRDSKAVHIKLDELLRSVKGARNRMVDIEEVSDEVLEELHDEFRKLHEKYTREVEEKNEKKHTKTLSVLQQLMSIIEKPLSEKR